jgi:hypothetical protein
MGQENWDRTGRTDQFLSGMPTRSNFYPLLLYWSNSNQNIYSSKHISTAINENTSRNLKLQNLLYVSVIYNFRLILGQKE